MTTPQELRQALAQAKEALTAVQAVVITAEDKWDESWPAKIGAALSALSAVLEKQDSSHLAAPTGEARSGSGVPARPTLPGELHADEQRVMREIAVEVVKERIEQLEADLVYQRSLAELYLGWYHKALAASPLPQEGRTPLTDKAIQGMARAAIGIAPDAQGKTVEITMDRGALFSFARAIEAAHGIGTQGEQKP